MHRLRITVLALLATLALTPLVSADHPGSNMGLARFEGVAVGPVDNLVHHLPEVQLAFGEWEAAWPEYVDRMVIGITGSGLPLEAIRITDESIDVGAANLSTGHKLRVYLDGGHHGNEFLGVELVMYYLEDLLNKVDAGDEATLAFFETHELYALPIVNVDGNSLDTRKNSAQVDVNRNYDFQWGGPGSGDNPWDLNYRGPSAFSEPEVLANAGFAQSIQPDLWITMHTGVAEFYWPWGWTHDPAPDQVFFESLEAPFEAATNGRVDAMQAAELYLAAGATDDYGYAVLGAPTFTFEVHEDQFIPVYGEAISQVVVDQLAGLDWMVQNTQRLGAWVEPHEKNGSVKLHNMGWAEARNVTVLVDGQVFAMVPSMVPDQMLALDLPAGAALVEVRHASLFIESSPVRMHSLALSGEGVQRDGEKESPGAGALVATLALLGLAFVARRR